MTEKKTIKKLTIEINDMVALKAAFPQIVETETVVQEVVNRQQLRKLVNAHYDIGIQIPGVRAYYASEEAEKAE